MSNAGSGLNLPADQMVRLQAAYAQPPRAYHNWQHVQEVLGHVETVEADPGWAQPREVRLAALYHDAFYDVGRSDNEVRSAALAAQQIARWIPDAGIDPGRVVELIELTARHGQFVPSSFGSSARDEDTRLFLDCDMAILGAEPDAFDAYDRAIAAEYRPVVPAWLYRTRRRAFLKALLARERIYLSDHFHRQLDMRARSNLRRAITSKR